MFASHAALMTSSRVKGSVYFDGSGDYLTVPTSTAFNFGTGDFCIECWVNLSSATGAKTMVSNYVTTPSGFGFQHRPDQGNGFTFGFGDTTLIATPTYTSTATWVHVAVSRSGTNLRMFLNGTQQGSTVTNSTNITSSASNLCIGSLTPTLQYFYGYLSNVRIANSAVYTSNFTPSTAPLTAISGTTLLTCQSPTSITDGSTNNFTITANGNAVASSQSPF